MTAMAAAFRCCLMLLCVGVLAAHGFVVVDLEVTVAGDEAVLSAGLDRVEFKRVLVAAGVIDAAFAAGDDAAWQSAAPEILAWAAGQATAATTWTAGQLTLPSEFPVVRLALHAHLAGGCSAVEVRCAWHPGHAPPAIYRLRRSASDSPLVRGENELAVLPLLVPVPNDRTLSRGWRFLVHGFLHVLPGGFDHIAFVLGIWLVARGWRQMWLLVTAFTVAHSLTLGLAATEVLQIGRWAWLVEVLIALSLIVVALETLRPARPTSTQRWRWMLVFTFGLIHGLGFAAALTDLGLPRHGLLVSLLAFNVGVEGAQLSVLLGATLALGWAVSRPWFRPVIALPLAASIAGMGAWWAVMRA